MCGVFGCRFVANVKSHFTDGIPPCRQWVSLPFERCLSIPAFTLSPGFFLTEMQVDTVKDQVSLPIHRLLHQYETSRYTVLSPSVNSTNPG